MQGATPVVAVTVVAEAGRLRASLGGGGGEEFEVTK